MNKKVLYFVIAVFLIEFALSAIHHLNTQHIVYSVKGDRFSKTPHPLSAGAYKPNIQFDSRLTVRNKIVFDETVSINEHGWRKVTGSDRSGRRQHAVILGCSYSFGWGLSDAQTLASQLQKRNPEIKFFNLSMPATSINFAYRTITAMKKDFLPGNGHAFFFFKHFHFDRIFPRSTTYREIRTPYYNIVDKKPEQMRLSNTYRFWLGVQQKLIKTGIGRFYIKWFSGYTLNDYNTNYMLQMILHTQNLYEQKFPGSKFYVVSNLGGWHKTEMKKHLMSKARSIGLRVIDLAEFFSPGEITELAPGIDQHPDADSIVRVAEKLNEFID